MQQDHIVFYDGDCALCNRFVILLLRWDQKKKLRFSALQSEFGQETLLAQGRSLKDFDTFLYLEKDMLFEKSTGILNILRYLGGGWSALGILRAVPLSLRDRIYDWVARNRRHFFDTADHCEMPRPEWKERFIS